MSLDSAHQALKTDLESRRRLAERVEKSASSQLLAMRFPLQPYRHYLTRREVFSSSRNQKRPLSPCLQTVETEAMSAWVLNSSMNHTAT
jgi:hypothetical protein